MHKTVKLQIRIVLKLDKRRIIWQKVTIIVNVMGVVCVRYVTIKASHIWYNLTQIVDHKKQILYDK